MGCRWVFSKGSVRVALVASALIVAIGGATRAPADQAYVCDPADLLCTSPIETPSGSTERACGGHSPGALARDVIYGTVGPVVFICDTDAAVAYGYAPGYLTGVDTPAGPVIVVLFPGF